MTDFPQAPNTDGDASESEDVLELDDSDFQRIEPTNKFKIPTQTAAGASTPVLTGTTQGAAGEQVVTGEVNIEVTPAPQPRPASQAPQSPPTHGAKNARQALQEALAQLQKNKQASALALEPTPAPGRPGPQQTRAMSAPEPAATVPSVQAAPAPATPSSTQPPPPDMAAPPAARALPISAAALAAGPPPAARTPPAAAPRPVAVPARIVPVERAAVSFEEDLTPLPSMAPAGWQAAITSEVAIVPAETSAFALPQEAMPAPESEWAAHATTEMEAPPSMMLDMASGADSPAALAVSPNPTLADLDFTTASSGPSVSTTAARLAAPNPAPPPAEASRPLPAPTAGLPRPAKAPPPASKPRPSLAEQARLIKGPAATETRPPPAGLRAPLTESEVTTPSGMKTAQQDLPYQQPLLTPLARGPAAITARISTTTEMALKEVLPSPPPPAPPEPAPAAVEAASPPWALEAPGEEAPAIMDLLPATTAGAATEPLAAAASSLALLSRSPDPATHAPPQSMGPQETIADATSPQTPPDLLALAQDSDADVSARTATEPYPAATKWPSPATRRAPRKRWLPVGAIAVTLLALAVLLTLRHHRPPLPAPVAQVTQPVAPKPPHEPHKDKVHAPKPVVPPVTEALTIESVDHLGYHALAVGVETMRNGSRSDPALLLWAIWRLATHFEDAAAKAALERTLDDLPIRGKVDVASPLLVAAQAGAAISLGRVPLAKRLLVALAKSPGANRWQTWYVQTVWQARHNMPPARLVAQLDRILRVAPNNADVRLWRAEALVRRNFNAGVRALAELARRKDPDVIARVAQVYTRLGIMQSLPSLLEPLDDGSRILLAAPAHQGDLLRLFAASRVLRGDYEAPRSIAEALARGDGNAAAVAAWARLTQYEGDDPGSVLQQGIDAQSDKAVRGWLLYEAVRLALERHDMNHAKFLADGMNSMAPGDIGVFAPLAAARVDRARSLQKQAKHHLASAIAADPNNRSVLIAQVLEASSAEVPARWTGAQPVPPEVLWQRAHATAALGQGSAAARMVEEVFWRDPTLFEPVTLLGAWSRFLDQAGEALRAESLLERLVAGLPDDDRPVIQLIKQARRAKRYDAAVQWYEVLLKRRPSDPEVTVELAKTYIDAQKPEAAAQVLSAAEHANPNVRTPVFMTTMAAALSKADPTRARNLLAVALRVQPSRDSYVLLADMENTAGHPEEELRALQAALPLAPDDGPLHLRVATLLRDKRMNNQAMALLQPLINNAEAMEMLGDLLQESGDLPDAMIAYQHADTAYQRADSARPDQAGLLVKVGLLQLNGLHNATAAIKTLQKAVSVAPQHADTFYWLSRAFARSGMHHVAKKLLLKYLRLAPDGTFAEEVRRELGGPRQGTAATAPE